MRQIEKFLFNVSFDEAELAQAEEAAKAALEETTEDESEELEVPTFSEAEVEAARAEGFEAGKAAGISEAGDAVETQISAALSQLTEQIGTLFHNQAVTNAELFDDAINIAIAISRKCFPHLNDTHGERAVEDMVKEVLAEILEEPRAVVHVHSDLVEPLNARISNIADAANFEGQVLIIDDDTMPPGDCRVSWSSGSAERDMNALWRKVDEIVEMNAHAVGRPDSIAAGESPEANRVQTPPLERPAGAPGPTGAPAPPLPSAPDSAADGLDAGLQGATESHDNQTENFIDINNVTNGETMETDAAPPSPEPSGSADTATRDSDQADTTGAHLQAGPGIVEEPDKEGILEAEQSENLNAVGAGAEEMDDAAEGMPPTGANL